MCGQRIIRVCRWNLIVHYSHGRVCCFVLRSKMVGQSMSSSVLYTEHSEQEQDQNDGELTILKCETRYDGELLESLCQLQVTRRVISRERFHIPLLERTQSSRQTNLKPRTYDSFLLGTKAALMFRPKDIATYKTLPKRHVLASRSWMSLTTSEEIGSPIQSHFGHKKEIACKHLLPSTQLPITCLTMKMMSLPLWLITDPECAKVRYSEEEIKWQERNEKRARPCRCRQHKLKASYFSSKMLLDRTTMARIPNISCETKASTDMTTIQLHRPILKKNIVDANISRAKGDRHFNRTDHDAFKADSCFRHFWSSD